MNLLGFTNLISYNNLEKRIVLNAPSLDQYGYPEFFNYKFEAINSISGYIWNGSN